MNEFFYCYNFNVFQHLKKQGVKYIVTAKNLNSDKQFWMYAQDSKLAQALNEYNK
ncbi:hypothetical protein [Enterococcus sp. AZ102]|uniref:hypothetical protein n=1 Tax=Enterococcus sp. AZ102 TaxID=2774865 RepID=UPI003F2329DC